MIAHRESTQLYLAKENGANVAVKTWYQKLEAGERNRREGNRAMKQQAKEK